jgi:aldose 1-epimerase
MSLEGAMPAAAPVTPFALSAGAIAVDLYPTLGGRIGRLRHVSEDGEFDFLLPLDPDSFDPAQWQRAGCFPMLPFTNKFRDNRLEWDGGIVKVAQPGSAAWFHGWGHRKAWSVDELGPSHCLMSLVVEESDAWPWTWRAELRFGVDPGGLDIVLQVTNLSTRPMPAGLGFHPYFAMGQGAEVTVFADSIWHGNPASESLPVLQRRLDGPLRFVLRRHALPRDTFTWFCETGRAAARIDYPGTQRHVGVSSPEAGHVVVHYRAGESFLCVEPCTHLAGRLDPAANVVPPGQRTRLSMRLDLG